MTGDIPDPAGGNRTSNPEAARERNVKLLADTTKALRENGLGQRIAEELAQRTGIEPDAPRRELTGEVEWMAMAKGEFVVGEGGAEEDPVLTNPSMNIMYREGGEGSDWQSAQVVINGSGEDASISVVSGPRMDVLSPDEVGALRDSIVEVARANTATVALPDNITQLGTTGDSYKRFEEHVTADDVANAPYNGAEPKEVTAARVLERQYRLSQYYAEVSDELAA
jgi:hypothetical protein